MIGFIRHGADAQEWDFVDFACVGDGGGFHISAETLVRVPEFARFFEFADELVAAQDTTGVGFGRVIAKGRQFSALSDLHCELRKTWMRFENLL